MTQFIGSALATNLIEQDDKRLLGRDYRKVFGVYYSFTLELFDQGFISEYWPARGGGFVGDQAADVALLTPTFEDFDYEYVRGATSRYGITGITRDYAGGILGGTTVKLFLTADDSLISTVVSDPTTGQYTVTTPFYPDTHYLVCYKSGSPDVFGTTPNTLIAG